VLDISLVPGCVSAEPNGMTYAELRDTLDAIARRTEIIAFDFVEVNPQLDVGTGGSKNAIEDSKNETARSDYSGCRGNRSSDG
jgi:agmatinase